MQILSIYLSLINALALLLMLADKQRAKKHRWRIPESVLLALCGKLFHHDRAVYNWVIGCTLVASVYDLLRSLPDTLRAACHLDGLLDAVGGVLPLAEAGLGWICPTLFGLVIGLIVHFAKKPRTN